MTKTLRQQVVYQMPEPGDTGGEASVLTDHSSGMYPRPTVLPRSRPPPSPLPVPSERLGMGATWAVSRAWETPMVQRSLKTSRLKPRNTDNSSRVRHSPCPVHTCRCPPSSVSSHQRVGAITSASRELGVPRAAAPTVLHTRGDVPPQESPLMETLAE